MSEDRLRRAVAAFSDVASTLGRGASVDDLLHAVAREISALVGVGRCSIYMRDEATSRFRGCVGRCGDESLDRDVKRAVAGGPADGMTAELCETQRPVVVTHAQDDPRTVKATVRFWSIRSIMAVPMVFAGEVVGVIFLDEAGRHHDFSDEDRDVATVFAGLAAVAFMHAQNHTHLHAEMEGAQRQLHALRRAAAVEDKLSELVLQGRPLKDLLDTLAQLLGKPCAVFDAAGTRVVAAVPEGADDGIAPRLLDARFPGRDQVREVLVEHDGSRAFVVGPLPAAGVLHRHVVVPVAGDELWGHLVVMEHKTRFTGGDMFTLRRAGTLIAIEVMAERRAVEADADAGSALLAELLGGCLDGNALRRRAEHLGLRFDVPRAVLELGSRDGSARALPDFRDVAAAWRRVAPGRDAQVAAVGDVVALLVGLPAGGDEAAFIAEQRSALGALREELPRGGRLIAGISRIHVDLDGYRTAFEEARQVVECIRRYAPAGGPPVLSADELGAGRLFLATSDAALVSGFAEETFGAMVSDETKADLLTTLCSFFENMASIRRTAARLGLHENTIRYRLSRIEELTGLAVTHDPDAQLRARMSLLVLLLQGRLPAAEAGEEPAPPVRRRLEVVSTAAV